jgi:DNA-binding LacI/PurR family transcriptional regulator
MSSLPLYSTICTSLQERIRGGALVPDDKGVLPTQVQLAQEYGVSLITVKRAIAELEKTGLVKSIRGRGLVLCDRAARRRSSRRTQRMKIGVAVHSMFDLVNNPFVAQQFGGLDAFCKDKAVDTLIFNYREDDRGPDGSLATQLADLDVDGLLVLTPVQCQSLAYLYEHKIRHVFIGNAPGDRRSVRHYCDPVAMVFKVTDALVKRACRKVVACVGDPGNWSTEVRASSFRFALESNGLPFDRDAALYLDFDIDAVTAALDRWIERYGPMDAIMAYDDVVGGAVKRHLASVGLPHVLVAGSGNVQAEQRYVDITTDNRSSEAAYNAIRMLCEMIDGVEPDLTNFCYDPELIVRTA